ncbi:DNA-binding MarR family transcriptional regulator [Enterococcus sp. PF1-24]|uniref:MarR family winged helix-turn-helix transcriptional regulator n=1 Tax=unclassified Enterococcus TaxID=2608891 RepID=UPI0024751184|nr:MULTISPECIES: MarR family transcriptional regulator [unclassified Enterococcus]MDH6364472.1 DNA-binding MarR family transcriptional regulator [Enterococcus sp. PFB1-1]MDH6401505.1 DNA-binding MarR family transcriptional regulator [Enterococcus sp. PF1-24]
MNPELRNQFFTTISKYKKIETAFSAEWEISVNELAILKRITQGCQLSKNGNTNLDIAEIRERLTITKPAVSYILNTLEKKQYITREIDNKDRRKVSITATEKGHKIVKQFSKKMENSWNLLLDNFGESEMENLVGSMEHLIHICEEIL